MHFLSYSSFVQDTIQFDDRTLKYEYIERWIYTKRERDRVAMNNDTDPFNLLSNVHISDCLSHASDATVARQYVEYICLATSG